MYRAWVIITLILSVLAVTQPTGESSTPGGGGFRSGLRRVGSKIGGSLKHPKRELYVCSKVETTILKQWDRSRWHLVAQCPPRDVGKLTKPRPQQDGQPPQENPPRRVSDADQNPGIGVSRLPLDKCLGWDEQNGQFTWTADGNGIEKGHCSECKVEGVQSVAEGEAGKGKRADKGKTAERGMSFTLTCKCDRKAGERGKADVRFELVPKVKVASNDAISCHGYKDNLHPNID